MSMNEKRIINLYLKYVDKKDEYNKDFNNDFDVLCLELNNYLDNLELKKLIELYTEYASIYNIRTFSNIDNFLDVLYEKIISKFKNVSLMKILDLYVNVFNSTLKIDENYKACKNTINARERNLNSEMELENLIKCQSKSRETFISEYKKENLSFKKELLYYQRSFEKNDKLQDAFLIYLESNFKEINEQERGNLLSTINRRIETNSKEILNRNNLLSNKSLLDIRRRFKDNTSLAEIKSSLDTSDLRNSNYIYESYRELLLEKNKINK